MDKQFDIEVPEIYSFRETLWYLDRGFDDCSHRVDGNYVFKALRYGGEIVLFRVSGATNAIRVEIMQGEDTPALRAHLKAYIVKWFDLAVDISPFYELLMQDERVAFMSEAYFGFRPVAINELFEALSWSIIGQQINLAFAFRLKRRITEKYGDAVEFGGEVYHIFPTPGSLRHVDPEDLKEMQFSLRKAEYLVNLAGRFATGEISEEIVAALPSFEQKQQFLTAYRGIGIWTANYALMKSMQIPEAVPYGDAGLYISMKELGIIRDKSETEKIAGFFAQFGDWQHYMVYYLWRNRSRKPADR